MAKGGCRHCGQRTTNPRLCRDCQLEKRHDTDAPTHRRAPVSIQDGRSVSSWIYVDGTWHASVAFDGHGHEFACERTFTDFPADRASLDHYGVDTEAICDGCRAALDPETVPIEWQRDGGFETAAELRTDGGQRGERR